MVLNAISVNLGGTIPIDLFSSDPVCFRGLVFVSQRIESDIENVHHAIVPRHYVEHFISFLLSLFFLSTTPPKQTIKTHHALLSRRETKFRLHPHGIDNDTDPGPPPHPSRRETRWYWREWVWHSVRVVPIEDQRKYRPRKEAKSLSDA